MERPPFDGRPFCFLSPHFFWFLDPSPQALLYQLLPCWRNSGETGFS
jgi:hypothetical protein